MMYLESEVSYSLKYGHENIIKYKKEQNESKSE